LDHQKATAPYWVLPEAARRALFQPTHALFLRGVMVVVVMMMMPVRRERGARKR
jgi:hypothetical protein